MLVKLNKNGFEHAHQLMLRGEVVHDERDAWSEHQPSAEDENAFIDNHGWPAFGKWHLGIDDEHAMGISSASTGAECLRRRTEPGSTNIKTLKTRLPTFTE